MPDGAGRMVTTEEAEALAFRQAQEEALMPFRDNESRKKAYLALRDMKERAEYGRYLAPDARHAEKGGQDVYHSALMLDGKLYSVTIRLDVVSDQQRAHEGGKGKQIEEAVRYKDHKTAEIETAPALYHGWAEGRAVQETVAVSGETAPALLSRYAQEGVPKQPAEAISEVSLGDSSRLRQAYAN